MWLINSLLSTGAGSRRMTEHVLSAKRLVNVRSNRKLQLRSATNYKLTFVGTIFLSLRIRGTKVRVVSEVIKFMAVQVVLDTSFIGKLIRGICLEVFKDMSQKSETIVFLVILEAFTDDEQVK